MHAALDSANRLTDHADRVELVSSELWLISVICTACFTENSDPVSCKRAFIIPASAQSAITERQWRHFSKLLGRGSPVIFGVSVYVTYCCNICSSNTVSKVRFTGKKLKSEIPGEIRRPIHPFLNDAPAEPDVAGHRVREDTR